jgi:protocatechuate 3,4-dioxygenase, alpha subunit
MVQKLDWLDETPSQTAGPYVHIGCIPTFCGLKGIYPEDLGLSPIEDGAEGEIVTITGSVFDGTGWAMRDAMLESWQPDAQGFFAGQPGTDPKVSGFARFAADGETGEFTCARSSPAPWRCPAAGRRRRISRSGSWRGGSTSGSRPGSISRTRTTAPTRCLKRVEQRQRVQTLLAKKTAPGQYRFDIHLQGENETVFLDL